MSERQSSTGRKSFLFWSALLLLVASVLAMSAYMFVPKPKMGCDFDLRVNEIACVLDGVDPYDVWSGKVTHPPYYPDVRPGMRSEEFTRRVNAYPPWAYTFGLPLALLPQWTAWYLYFAFHFLALIGLGLVGYRYAKAELGHACDVRLAAIVPLLMVVFALGSCFQSGNYPIVVLAATLGLVWCLDRGHDVLAGLCWALAMIKPQMALLYAVPLLFRRKFLVCAVAAATCLVASVPPALLCHKGIVELIVNGVAGPACGFNGCGTCPLFLLPALGQTACVVTGLVVGAALCGWLTWKTPSREGWLVYLAPAVYIATAWTYSQLYSSLVSVIPLWLIVIALIRKPRSRALWAVFALAALFMPRAYTFCHGFTMLFPGQLGYSWYLHGVLDSLNSLLGLVPVVWFWLVVIGRSDVQNAQCEVSANETALS